MFLLFLQAIPIVNLIVMLVLAFAGDNQTRKNYYRAMLVWLLLLVVAGIVFALVIANSPAFQQYLRNLSTQ
jgi:nitrate/nitrite transporter NarK